MIVTRNFNHSAIKIIASLILSRGISTVMILIAENTTVMIWYSNAVVLCNVIDLSYKAMNNLCAKKNHKTFLKNYLKPSTRTHVSPLNPVLS